MKTPLVNYNNNSNNITCRGFANPNGCSSQHAPLHTSIQLQQYNPPKCCCAFTSSQRGWTAARVVVKAHRVVVNAHRVVVKAQRGSSEPNDFAGGASEADLDSDTFDPYSNDLMDDDDDDVDYPPHLRLSASTATSSDDPLDFLEDPDEFWQMVMDEEAYDEKFYNAAVEDAGAAEKPTILARMEKQKARISIEQYIKMLPQMQEHESYVSNSVYEYVPVPETIDDPLPLHRTNPDWDEWDFRAYLESEKRRKAVDAMWHAEQAKVGRFVYEEPNWKNDIRLHHKVPDDTSEWSEEQVLELITQNGRSPRIEEVCHQWVLWVLKGGKEHTPERWQCPTQVGALTVCNPWQRADFLAAGYQHTPEVDEYIEQLGRMLHEGQEDEADREVGWGHNWVVIVYCCSFLTPHVYYTSLPHQGGNACIGFC